MNKVVLVTGASKGIGKATALLFAKEGYDIAICARKSPDLTKTKKEIERIGVKCIAEIVDVKDLGKSERFVKKVSKNFGKIDIIVNNAGIFPYKNFEEMNEKEWKEIIDININGIFNFTKAVIPVMKKQHSGIIINIASGAGKKGYPKLAVYCATKFAVIGFTESIAPELEHYGIKVYAVCPGETDTEGYKKVFKERASTPPEKVAEVIKKIISQNLPTGSSPNVWDY